MNQDRIKGTVDELTGSAKRKAGEWTGDTPLQVEGITQKVKGKIENSIGKIEDAIDEANREADAQHDSRA